MKRKLATSFGGQCNSRRKHWTGRIWVWLRCQLVVHHNGQHFGPYGQEWKKTRNSTPTRWIRGA